MWHNRSFAKSNATFYYYKDNLKTLAKKKKSNVTLGVLQNLMQPFFITYGIDRCLCIVLVHKCV